MRSLMLCLAALGAPATLVAQTQPQDSVVIDRGFEQSSGVAGVNIAAGNNNQQANVGVIASGGTAIATGTVIQRANSATAPRSGAASALIEGSAFSGSAGMIAVNVASGNDNQQANLALIAVGIDAPPIADATLSQTRGSLSAAPAITPSDHPDGVTGIGPDAFANGSGLVQLSLIGGDRNTSANSFTLTVPAGVDQ